VPVVAHWYKRKKGKIRVFGMFGVCGPLLLSSFAAEAAFENER